MKRNKEAQALRDYFAAMALPGIIGKHMPISVYSVDGVIDPGAAAALLEAAESVASGAYAYADAMLAERAK